jgi:outer membrane receptor protein involved in Fe transport
VLFLHYKMEIILKMIYKIFIISTIFLLIGTNPSSGQDNPKRGTGKISGTVLDKETNLPIESAVVKLDKGKDSTLITGAESNSSGKFVLDNVPFGFYTLRISMVGYSSSIIRDVILNRENKELTYDSIKLKSGATTTEEIVIESEKSPVQFQADKKVFNLEQNINNKGSNALDVLRNLPGVTVDVDGNVSLRGSQNVRIMINGKPFGLDGSNRVNVLEQLSAEQISSIELITNPSAKYDAQGESGIINLLLKKSDEIGYNGNIDFNAGTKDKYNGALAFNFKKNLLNVFGNYNYRSMNFDMTGGFTREYVNSTAFSSAIANSISNMRMRMHMVKAGIEYGFDPLNTISLSASYNNRSRKRNGTENSYYYDINNNISTRYDLSTTDNSNENNLDFNLSYTKKFKNPKQNLTFDFAFAREKESSQEGSTQNYIVPVINPVQKNQNTEQLNDELIAQTDYVQPFKNDSRLEAGLKYNYNKEDIDLTTLYADTLTGAWYTNTDLTYRSIFKEHILAAYSTYTGKLGKLEYQGGLRVENAYILGDVVTVSKTFNNNYFGIFPSVSFAYNLTKTDELQASYSRRVNRPHMEQLSPMIEVTDPTNIRVGNPNLKPEYIDSYELGYLKFIGKTTVTPSLFFRYTHDQITRIRELVDSITTLTTFANNASSKSFGGELLVNSQILPWWNLNASFSYYNVVVDGTNIDPAYSNNTNTWSSRIQTSARIPSILDLQINYFYSGKMVTGQGEIEPMQSMDISLKKDFFNKRLTLGLRLSDVFNTMKFVTKLNDGTLIEDRTRKRDSRVLFLTMSYKFGNEGKANERRKKRDNGNDTTPEIDY